MRKFICSNPEGLDFDVEVFFFQGGKVENNHPCDYVLYPRGFYWWARRPGKEPVGDPIGPFETEREAVCDAQGGEPLIFELEEVI